MKKKLNVKNKMSIIICCYNSASFLNETLESVKQQTYKNWEIVIINDGSSDNTEKIILDFKLSNKNLSIIYYKQENKGLSASRNKAVELANFEWIAILDHDDVWLKNKLEIQNKEIILNPTCNLFFGDNGWLMEGKKINKKTRFNDTNFFDPRKLTLNKKIAYKNLIEYGCFITSSTVIFYKPAFLNINGFNLSYKFISDYIFFNQIAKKNDLYCSSKTLCNYRYSNNQATNKMNSIYILEMINFYKHLYKSNLININIKLILFKRHIKLLIKHFLNIIN